MEWFLKFYTQGGSFMHAITATAVMAVTIVVYRVYALFFKYNINAEAFMAQVQKLVMANNIDRAIKLCNAAPDAALPRVVKAGLTRANKTENEIASHIEEATLEVVPQVEAWGATLQPFANIATLFGLLGTIVGLIQSFQALAFAEPSEKAVKLASGISVAMNTTAYGLFVAIPTLVFQLFIQNRTKKIIDELDLWSVETENLLLARVRAMRQK